MMHLIKDNEYAEVWCEAKGLDVTSKLEEATCPDCLRMVVEFGKAAAARLAELAP